jgi:IMP dehydrogenase/GMP reductase
VKAWPPAFDYDHISLAPRLISEVAHRGDVKPEVEFGPLCLRLPILGSPMPDVCGTDMARALALEGALGVLHRFDSIESQVASFAEAGRGLTGSIPAVAAAIGVSGDYRERFQALREAGCKVICLDTANGAHRQVATAIEWVKKADSSVFLIAGNVATAEGFRWLEEEGADAIRVGIAGGSVCETRNETGIYVPTPYAVAEAASVRKRALIIGDGGVRMPADLTKLVALGADVVMLGSALAGTREALGRVIVVDGKRYKIMRGAASFSVQQESAGERPQYVEGAETLVPYKGRVEEVLQRYQAGLRSSMSYLNAATLGEFRSNASFLRVAPVAP